MNATHTRLAATATRLIAANGRPMELIPELSSGQTWDADVDGVPIPVLGVQTKVTQNDRTDLYREGDIMLLVDATQTATTDMKLRDLSAGKIYSIIDVSTIMPGSVMILQKIHARS